jgi:shikimate dehydrogenase
MMAYAEIIGDPIAQSKSPIIHKHWLEMLGIEGDYIRTRLAGDELAEFISKRRSDPDWRGCNVTIPHKQAVMPLLDRIDAGAAAIGAVNCVVPEEGGLAGYNSDIDGVAEALDSADLNGRKAAVIGAGGGARAVVAYLAGRGTDIVVLARNPAKAEDLRNLAAMQILPLEDAAEAFDGAAVIVNATSLGMAGAEPMPESLLKAVRENAARALLFDIVTTPPQTDFLACGERRVDGLTMLIGQARRAFQFFFGQEPPRTDGDLRRLLTGVNE